MQPTISDPFTGPAEAALSPAAEEAACANCGAALFGPFCAQCGQRAESRVMSLRSIIEDALEDQLSLNAALPRTLATLLRRPGRLTTEYVRGRVMRYIPPMRLYLGVSVLYFLLYAVVPRPYEQIVQERRTPSAAAGIQLSAGPTTGPQRGAAYAPVRLKLGDAAIPAWLRPAAARLGAQMKRLKAMDPQKASQLITSGMAGAAPKVMFVMLPIFALLLKLLYVRRQRLYVEHFVFALHVHALAFLVFMPLLFLHSGWKMLGYGGIALYVLLALRAVYGQGWGRTVLKFALLGASYLVVIGVGVAVALVATVMSL